MGTTAVSCTPCTPSLWTLALETHGSSRFCPAQDLATHPVSIRPDRGTMTNIMFIGLLVLCGGGFSPSWGACCTAAPPSAVEPGGEEKTGGFFYQMKDCSQIPSGSTDLRVNVKMTGTISCDTNKVTALFSLIRTTDTSRAVAAVGRVHVLLELSHKYGKRS